jgi:hypothetical protein
MRGLAALALFALAVFSLASLIFGASYLEFSLPGGLPVGNALAAIWLACVAALSVLLSPADTTLRGAALASLAVAASWLPLSIALAGNLALNFAGGRGSFWLGFTLAVTLVVLSTFVWALFGRLLGKRKRVDAVSGKGSVSV